MSQKKCRPWYFSRYDDKGAGNQFLTCEEIIAELSSLISDPLLNGHRVLWEKYDNKENNHDQQLQYGGTPFMILGTRILDCHPGVDRHQKSKKRRMEDTKKVRKKLANIKMIQNFDRISRFLIINKHKDNN